MSGLLTVISVLLFFGYGLVQISAGYIGIDFYFGGFWAGLALFVAFVFRFTLPITIGSFFAAIEVFGWHWIIALLFAAPGLAFVIPGVIGSIVSVIKR